MAGTQRRLRSAWDPCGPSSRARLRRPWVHGVVCIAMQLSAACEVGDERVPDGKLAVVGDVVLGPEDVAGIKAQLGAYAQLRFSGEGKTALLQAIIATELLAQEAIDAGLGDDPRVRFAVLEELAELHRSAELERRLPRASVAADTAALRAYYDAHPEQFAVPERRNLEGVYFRTAAEAEDAQRRLAAAEVTLPELGEVVSTPLQARDDLEHPGFHALLFDPTLRAGAWLPAPVLIGTVLVSGRVQQVVPATVEPFDDDSVQERLVEAVRRERLVSIRADLQQTLAERFAPADP